MTPRPEYGGLDLFCAAPAETAVYYEWLLGHRARSRPGEALGALGVRFHRARDGGPTGWLPALCVRPSSVPRIPGEYYAAPADSDIAEGIEQGFLRGPDDTWIALTDTPRVTNAIRYTNADISTEEVAAVVGRWSSALGGHRVGMFEDPYDMELVCAEDRVLLGVFRVHGEVPGMPRSFWIGYFEVRDLGTVVARAVESGSRVLMAPSRSPFNQFAVLTDPWGHVFGVSRIFDHSELGGITVVAADGAHRPLLDVLELPGPLD